ncbi:unnamed protein product [Linum trigynum]|uniref:Uncharacterized protein n=1 Tax=Linum trigynum TaxID=586398 RepID=A0AAV2FU92_9ROSI
MCGVEWDAWEGFQNFGVALKPRATYEMPVVRKFTRAPGGFSPTALVHSIGEIRFWGQKQDYGVGFGGNVGRSALSGEYS